MPESQDFVVRVHVPAGALADKVQEIAAQYPDGAVPLDALATAIGETLTADRLAAGIREAAAEVKNLFMTGENAVERLRTGHV